MKYIFIIAAFNALFYVILLLQKKQKASHDKVLIAWLTYLGLFIGTYAFSSEYLVTGNQLWPVFLITLFLLHGPFLYFYVQSLIYPRQKWQSGIWIHLSPFIAFVLYLSIASFYPEYAIRIRIDHVDHGIRSPAIYSFFLILTVLSGPFYIYLTYRLFRNLDIDIFNHFSYSEEINLDWLKKLTYVFGFVWTALMIIAVIHHILHLFSMMFCLNGLFLTLSAFVILIGYYGLRQEKIFVNHIPGERNTESAPDPASPGLYLNADQTEQYTVDLTNHMKTEKPYLNPKLTIQELADQVDIPAHHISKLINDHFGQNFFEFVNQYRVEEVKSRLNNDKYSHFSLLGIAYESGFNSKSAFNRVFKKLTGTTPSQYKKGR